MKPSGSAANRRDVRLIVDGYNVLARQAGEALQALPDIDAARERLIDALSEYQAFAGVDVEVVFDAHRTAEPERVYEQAGVQVVFTGAGETADAYIERRVYELRGSYRQIAVATSDAAEQQVAFGGGALRLSAQGLLQLLAEAKQAVQGAIVPSPLPPRGTVRDRIGCEIANVLEKWRRQGSAGD